MPELIVLALGHNGGTQSDFAGRRLVDDFQRHNRGSNVTNGGGFDEVDGFGTRRRGRISPPVWLRLQVLGLPIPVHQGHVNDFVIAEPNDFLSLSSSATVVRPGWTFARWQGVLVPSLAW